MSHPSCAQDGGVSRAGMMNSAEEVADFEGMAHACIAFASSGPTRHEAPAPHNSLSIFVGFESNRRRKRQLDWIARGEYRGHKPTVDCAVVARVRGAFGVLDSLKESRRASVDRAAPGHR